jgi:hypothetical protein
MQIICGPAHDRRSLELDLALPFTAKIGVLTSGGVDSTLLYYLILYIKYRNALPHYIRPIVILRKEGSKYFARPIVQKINAIWGHPLESMRLGNTTLPEHQQVQSAVKQAIDIFNLHYVYIGLIANRAEHTVGFDIIPVPTLPQILTPLKQLEKSHVIDLYYQFGIQDLLKYTHSCDQSEQMPCGVCNGCQERSWGFSEIGKTDPARAM